MKFPILVLLGTVAWARGAFAEEGQPTPPDRIDLDTRPAGRPFASMVEVAPSDGALRPVPALLERDRFAERFATEIPLGRRLSLYGETIIAQQVGSPDVHGAAAQVGANLRLGNAGPVALAVQGGFLRELAGDPGGFVQATVTYDRGRLRLAALGHVECMGGTHRDPVDVYAVAAASVRLAAPLRLGISYVAQDLEEAVDDEHAEGGVRNYVGPDIAISLDRERVTLTAGAAFGLANGQTTPGTLARAGISFLY
jgi:hypothetical protein